MKKLALIFTFFCTTGILLAQQKTTSSAIVTFDATTEKDALPKAENKTVIGAINTTTGEIAFEAAVNNFSFSNPRMQEHFNGDNWFKSATYPVFSYRGKIENLAAIKFTKDGVYKVSVAGEMKVRDISKKEKITGTVAVKGEKIILSSEFNLSLDDYKITGAPVEAGKIAKEPKISVVAEF